MAFTVLGSHDYKCGHGRCQPPALPGKIHRPTHGRL